VRFFVRVAHLELGERDHLRWRHIDRRRMYHHREMGTLERPALEQ